METTFVSRGEQREFQLALSAGGIGPWKQTTNNTLVRMGGSGNGNGLRMPVISRPRSSMAALSFNPQSNDMNTMSSSTGMGIVGRSAAGRRQQQLQQQQQQQQMTTTVNNLGARTSSAVKVGRRNGPVGLPAPNDGSSFVATDAILRRIELLSDSATTSTIAATSSNTNSHNYIGHSSDTGREGVLGGGLSQQGRIMFRPFSAANFATKDINVISTTDLQNSKMLGPVVVSTAKGCSSAAAVGQDNIFSDSPPTSSSSSGSRSSGHTSLASTLGSTSSSAEHPISQPQPKLLKRVVSFHGVVEASTGEKLALKESPVPVRVVNRTPTFRNVPKFASLRSLPVSSLELSQSI